MPSAKWWTFHLGLKVSNISFSLANIHFWQVAMSPDQVRAVKNKRIQPHSIFCDASTNYASHNIERRSSKSIFTLPLSLSQNMISTIVTIEAICKIVVFDVRIEISFSLVITFQRKYPLLEMSYTSGVMCQFSFVAYINAIHIIVY